MKSSYDCLRDTRGHVYMYCAYSIHILRRTRTNDGTIELVNITSHAEDFPFIQFEIFSLSRAFLVRELIDLPVVERLRGFTKEEQKSGLMKCLRIMMAYV
jgi:hypothetical protein